MIAKLPLVPFVIINLTRLTAGVCMKVRFKSKVTRDFSLLAASRLSRGSRKTSGTRVVIEGIIMYSQTIYYKEEINGLIRTCENTLFLV